MDKQVISRELGNKMEALGIDVNLTLQVLNNYNQGKYDHFTPVKVTGVPAIDGKKIIDMTGPLQLTLNAEEARQRLKKLGVQLDITALAAEESGKISLNRTALEKLGVRLYPLLAYGVLNGGSASSYVDLKKNEGFNAALLDICKKDFTSLAEESRGKAKGITPAFVNPDGTHGPSFLELKMRAVLIECLRYQILYGNNSPALYPMYQMTSVYNHEEIIDAYAKYQNNPLLKDLIKTTGLKITHFETGIQPMLGALTHSNKGRPKSIFLNAFGKENTPLPMPGGHGQNFTVLKDVFKKLYQQGKRFVSLGNVDNIGYTVEPVALAVLALQGSQAGFDFAFRTPVDIKGGVLVIDQHNKLNCADIGAAISKDEILKLESQGEQILFNCASGLFNLEYLVENLEKIIHELPMRISDQQKDSGEYSQAEQITWEIIGILDDILIFGVDKYSRFLAAKLLIEGLMTSGIGLENPAYPTDTKPEQNLKLIAGKLNTGLNTLLSTAYGMKLVGSHWVAKSPEELSRELR